MNNIDPEWAWQPFEPSSENPWNGRLAAHLFRRAGFGADRKQLDDAVERQPAAVVTQLVDGPEESTELDRENDDFAQAVLAGGDPKQLSAWWLYLLLRTTHPVREKMTLFWHGHFATSAEKVQDANAMYAQNQLLRRHALGDFAELVQSISRDPAMLIYLDSVTNRKSHPNENYARELMELFCLGEGHYAEQDVQQLARCFTGWEIRRGRYRFNRYQHDFGEKDVLGTTGSFPDGSVIDVVLQQPAASRFIAGKLVRYFVFDEPMPDAALIEPLAKQLRDEAWNVSGVVRTILGSNLFFSEHAVGRKVRSPVELTVGLLRCLDGSTNAQILAEELVHLGQGLFYPPNVKGWDGGRAWINASTLLGRANVMGRLLRDKTTRYGGGELEAYFRSNGCHSADEVVTALCELTLAVPLPGGARESLVSLADQAGGNSNQRIAKTIHALAALPEFQLG